MYTTLTTSTSSLQNSPMTNVKCDIIDQPEPRIVLGSLSFYSFNNLTHAIKKGISNEVKINWEPLYPSDGNTLVVDHSASCYYFIDSLSNITTLRVLKSTPVNFKQDFPFIIEYLIAMIKEIKIPVMTPSLANIIGFKLFIYFNTPTTESHMSSMFSRFVVENTRLFVNSTITGYSIPQSVEYLLNFSFNDDFSLSIYNILCQSNKPYQSIESQQSDSPQLITQNATPSSNQFISSTLSTHSLTSQFSLFDSSKNPFILSTDK